MPKTTNYDDNPPARNLRSGHTPDPLSRKSPDTNKFDVFESSSDDESVPSRRSLGNKIDNLCSVVTTLNTKSDKRITDLNDKFEKKLESMFKVLTAHNELIADRNSMFASSTTDRDTKDSSVNVSETTSNVHATAPTAVSFRDSSEPAHGSDKCLPYNTGGSNQEKTADIKSDIDKKLPPTENLAPSYSDRKAPTNMFAQNEFSLIINDVSKIKYLSMETYLKDRNVQDDSVRSIEKMYIDIIMSLTFVFERDLSFIPNYSCLSRDICFGDLFLDNLHGMTLKKCHSVFTRLGSILKSRLTSPGYISSTKCPKTSIVIRANPLATGWELLEKILCDRLIICGGVPDYDLDAVRATLAFQQQETYIDFYIRTQHLLNEYELCYSNRNFIPTIKITNTFITELNRAPEYVPLLTVYHQEMITHIKAFGDVDNSYSLPFTIHDVYELLNKMNAPMTPSTLRPSRKVPSLQQTFTSPEPPPKDDFNEFIACLETTIDEDCSQPTICAKMVNNRQRCQACLLGFHRELDCYLRGPNFQPKDLKRRIKIYNQLNGDSPPPGHKIREYTPRGKEAVHQKHPPIVDKKTASKSDNHVSFQMKRPFSNFHTKTKGQINHPGINALEVNDDNNDSVVDNTVDPTITSFMSSQLAYDYNHNDDDNDTQPTICTHQIPTTVTVSTYIPPPQVSARSPNYKLRCFTPTSSLMTSALINTPLELRQIIYNNHLVRNLRPSKKFLRQHCRAVEQLPIKHFIPYCSTTFHVDGGANCGGVNDKRLFYFFIDTHSNIEQVGGDHVHSPGWGGILVKINDRINMIAPVYYCPNNPRNTLSTTSLLQFCAYNEAIVNTNRHLKITDTRQMTSTLPFDIHNDLDHVTLEIMAMSPCVSRNVHQEYESRTHPTIAAAKISLRRSPRLQLLNTHGPNSSSNHNTTTAPQSNTLSHTSIITQNVHDTNKNKNIFQKPASSTQYNIMVDNEIVATVPRTIIAHIASMYINLHNETSPRQNAIKEMNTLLYNFCNSTINHHKQIPQEPVDNTEYLVPVIANFNRSLTRTSSPTTDWIRLHFGLMHASPTMMKTIISRDLLTDIPPSLKTKHTTTCACYICLASKTNKLPRGPPVTKLHLRPFERLHIDFSFFGETSIRGFTTALDITCGSTSYAFGFPSKSKSPPLQIIRWVISTIRSMGYTVLFVRVDEDSSLANSSEFCTLIQNMNCLLETTGGGNSTNNGMVESGNRARGNMVRSILSTMNLIFGKHLPSDIKIEAFWCFAYQHACFTQRRLYNRMRDEIPYKLVHGTRPSALECVIPGSVLTIIDPNKHLKPKLDRSRTKRGYFLGFANHCKVRIYFDPQNPTKIKRSAHCIVEDVVTMSIILKSIAFINENDPPPSIDNLPDALKNQLVSSDAWTPIKDPFPNAIRTTITLMVPPPNEPIGITIKNDEIFNIPYVHHCVPHSAAYNAIPPGKRRNQFIVGLNNDSPITAAFVKSQLQEAQHSSTRQVTLYLLQRPTNSGITTLAGTRAMFDQLPSVLHNRPIIASQHYVPNNHDHFITAPTKPSRPKTIFDAFKTPYKHNWKVAAWNQFQKNHQIAVFSLPFPAKNLPHNARVFQSQLIPEIKNTDVAGMYELKVRDVIVGTPQLKNIDFSESYSPTIDPVTIKVQLALAASRNYIIGVIDVKNAFQNTIASPSQRIYVSASKLYLEWASKTLDFKYDDNEKYLRQMLNSNQGTKNAGNLWYNLLSDIISKYGLVRSTTDHGYFVKALDDGTYLMIGLATDDLLVTCASYAIFDALVTYLRQFFELSIQNGKVIKFLGLRIIQSDDCVTIDQGEYTFEILETYFGKDVDKIKTLSSPMRYDSDYERDLHDALPLSPQQLKQACAKYKGGFRFWTGKFIHLCTQTRPDICYATQKLSEYNNNPTEVAFESIVRVLRYLAGDVLRPLVYPRKPMTGHTKVSWYATPEQKFEVTVPNTPSLFADAELARCLATRRTYYCIIITIFNVFVLMKVKKTSTIMQHTTDAEMKASYDGVKHLLPIRQLFAFSGSPLTDPSQMFTDNAAVHAIIDSKRMTPRCRHFDLPIAFLHQEKDRSFQLDLCRTLVMLADMGTKPHTPQYVKLFKYWASGAQYLPPPDSQHYKLLQMQYYEKNYAEIIKIIDTTNG